MADRAREHEAAARALSPASARPGRVAAAGGGADCHGQAGGGAAGARAVRRGLTERQRRAARVARAGAREAYGRGPRDASAPGWTREAQFAHARLLVQEKRWDAARPILERLLKSS